LIFRFAVGQSIAQSAVDVGASLAAAGASDFAFVIGGGASTASVVCGVTGAAGFALPSRVA
jgi:hypothetical protein